MCGEIPTWPLAFSDMATALAYFGIPLAVLRVWIMAGRPAVGTLAFSVAICAPFVLLCGAHHAIIAMQAMCVLMGKGCPDMRALHLFIQYAMTVASWAVLVVLLTRAKEMAAAILYLIRVR